MGRVACIDLKIDFEIVEAICDHPGIEAVSFVGSTKVAKIVYKRATNNYKRCLALGGAKNHLLVLPDAKAEMNIDEYDSQALSRSEFSNNALWLDVVSQRFIVNVFVAESSRSSYPQPSFCVGPSWTAGDAQDRHSITILELRHAKRSTRCRVQNTDQIRHARNDLLRPIFSSMLGIDVFVLERDLDRARRDNSGDPFARGFLFLVGGQCGHCD